MADLDSYSRELENFRASDEARERLVSVTLPCRVVSLPQHICIALMNIPGAHRKVQAFVQRAHHSKE
jgi:hypothetical protein